MSETFKNLWWYGLFVLSFVATISSYLPLPVRLFSLLVEVAQAYVMVTVAIRSVVRRTAVSASTSPTPSAAYRVVELREGTSMRSSSLRPTKTEKV